MAVSKATSLYSPYGSYELKAKYQRNFALGTIFTASFVALILLAAFVISRMGGDEAIEAPSVVIKTVADLGPPPSIAKKPPQVQVNQPNVAAPKVGIPKPVADDEVVDEDVVIATQDELADISRPDITDQAGGDDIVVDINDEDFLPAPDDFVPVEIYPEMIYEYTPPYPRLAEQAGITGRVWVKALVDEEGNVIKSMLGKTSGTPALDEAAVEAAYKNKFKPGIQNGRPVKVWVTYKVDFQLDR